MLRTFSLEARAVVPTTQNEADEDSRWNGTPDGSEPWRAYGAKQKIGSSKNQIGQRKSPAKAQLVGNCASEDGQEPNHSAEDPGKRSGLFCGEIQFFMEIVGQRGECPIVRKALEDFADVGDPERSLESIADFLKPLPKAHDASRMRGAMIVEQALEIKEGK